MISPAVYLRRAREGKEARSEIVGRERQQRHGDDDDGGQQCCTLAAQKIVRHPASSRSSR